MKSIVERGHPVGRFVGDRGYLPFAKLDDLAKPVRRLGYSVYMEYKKDQLGVRGGYEGAIMVEGAFYCPATTAR